MVGNMDYKTNTDLRKRRVLALERNMRKELDLKNEKKVYDDLSNENIEKDSNYIDDEDAENSKDVSQDNPSIANYGSNDTNSVESKTKNYDYEQLERQRAYQNYNQENNSENEGLLSMFKKGSTIRLMGFVFLAGLLLLLLVKDNLVGSTPNSTFLLFLVVFVILFSLGKGGEKNIFS
jgi:hypothetical protein